MNWLLPLGVTDVDVNVIEGFSPVPKKSLVRRWASRCVSLVSMLSALISTETRPLIKLSPSVSIVPDGERRARMAGVNGPNRPRGGVRACVGQYFRCAHHSSPLSRVLCPPFVL